MADQVLIVERSITCRAKLKKALAFTGYTIRFCELFEQVIALLGSPETASNEYAAIIIGWPSYMDSAADSLLNELCQQQHTNIPVLVISEELNPEKVCWINTRPLTTILRWEDLNTVASALQDVVNTAKQPLLTSKAPHSELNSSISILLVDDSATVRQNFSLLLKRNGYSIQTASSVNEALTITSKQTIDILIVDYFMPQNNGDVLIRQLKSGGAGEKIEIAVLTGSYSDKIIRDCLNAGAIDCIFKSEGSELFLTRINSIASRILSKRSIGHERDRLQHILSAVGDGIFGVDSQGLVQFINPAALRMLGAKSDDQLIGHSAMKLFHHSDADGNKHTKASCALHNSYMEGSLLTGHQTVFWGANGESFPVECTLNPLRYDKQAPGAIVVFRNIEEQLERESELRWLASHDPLTKMMNRETFEEALNEQISQLKASDKKSALIFLDVDRFKYVNDTAGHQAGDKILMEIGNRLISQLADNDHIARMSGDEFAIILADVDTQPNKILESADRFREVIECQKFYVDEQGLCLSASVTGGVAILDKDTLSSADCMSKAGQACNMAKTRGRNCIQVYDSENNGNTEPGEDLGWATKLHDAVVWNRFQIHYQPIVNLADVPRKFSTRGMQNNWVHWNTPPPNRFEALIRLRDSHGKLVSPDAFLPLAERFEMVGKIDRWVIQNTFKEMAESGWAELEIFVNMSVITLMAPDLPEFIKNELDQTGINPQNIVFEITESSAVKNITEANQCIGKLRDLGLRFALDDFGSGYSSFYNLKNLDVDIIKIDGIFTGELYQDQPEQSMIFSINEVAHSMGKETVVEHIDRPEVLKAIMQSSVDYLQGYFISEPFDSLPKPISQADVADK